MSIETKNPPQLSDLNCLTMELYKTTKKLEDLTLVIKGLDYLMKHEIKDEKTNISLVESYNHLQTEANFTVDYIENIKTRLITMIKEF